MKFLNNFRIFITLYNFISKTKIILDPPPRVIKKKLLSSKKIYLHSVTGPIRKNENDLLFKKIEIYYLIFGVLSSEKILTIFLFTNLSKFYQQTNQSFKDWLLEPENELVFFNYGYGLIPFLELINMKSLIKAIIFLHFHFQDFDYEWVLSFSKEKMNIWQYYKKYDQPLLPSLIDSMFEGLNINLELYESTKLKLEQSLSELAQEFNELFGIAFNRDIFYSKSLFKSTLAPQTWVFNKKKSFPKDTSGNPSTSAVTLKTFRFEHKIEDARLNLIISLKEIFSELEKLTTFFRSKSEKLFFNIKLAGARTGRITTSAPNVQGIPTQFKNIVVPKKGFLFYIMDLGQAELKIIAHLIQEETMLKIFSQGQDIHAYFAAKLLNLSYDDFITLKEKDQEKYKHYRNIAKLLNFSLLYGMSIPTLQKRLLENGFLVSFTDAQHYYTNWHSTFPGVKIYHQKVQDLYKKEDSGNMFQTFKPEFQLKQYITSICGTKNVHFEEKKATTRTLSNFPIQSTCAEILKQVYIRYLPWEASLGKVKLTVHDEIIIECLQENAAEIKLKMTDILEEVRKEILPSVPLDFEYRLSEHW